MLNRKEIIEAIARAIYSAEHQQIKERNGRNNAWVDSFTYDDENHEFRRMQLREKAEAALDAFLSVLPTGYTLEEKTCGKTLKGEDVIIDSVIYDDRAEIYKQLLALRGE